MTFRTISVTALLSLSSLAFADLPRTEARQAKGFPATSISVAKYDTLRGMTVRSQVVRGMTEKQVIRLLGKPEQELAPDLVEYRNCAPDQEVARNCDLLVIRYKDGKVDEMIFANRPMTEALALQAIERSTPDKTQIPSAIAAPDTQQP